MHLWLNAEGFMLLTNDLKEYRNPWGYKLKIENRVINEVRVKLSRRQVRYLQKTVDIRSRYERK